MNIPNNNCINCNHFIWKDGDYFCSKYMKIFQNSPDKNFNKDILISLLLHKNCKDYSLNENSLYIDKFNDYIKTINK